MGSPRSSRRCEVWFTAGRESPLEAHLYRVSLDGGEPKRVIEFREGFQRMMATRYRDVIEELTGRTVVAFLSQAHVEPDITMEIFFFDPGRSRVSAVGL